MYYPIFRGKQYEFLTIKDLIPKINESGKIVPVIEPVKNTKRCINSLLSCLDELKKSSLEAIFIINPRCVKGDFYKKKNEINALVRTIKTDFPNVSIGYWIGHQSNESEIYSFLEEIESKFYLLHYSEFNELGNLLTILREQNNFKGHFLDEETLGVDYISSITSKRILLKDSFIRREPNEEYRGIDDEYFDCKHIKYKEKKYDGFSDYLIIGSKYDSGGDTPETVAIHLTYESDESDEIRIKHCLSDHYPVNQDRGEMIREALREVSEFLRKKPEILNFSSGCCELLKCLADEDKNTSLANIKRLSMNHHLELIISLLNREDTYFKEAS